MRKSRRAVRRARCIGGVALAHVRLDDGAAAEHRRVRGLVLLGVVRVHRVRHVRREHNSQADALANRAMDEGMGKK